MTGTIDLAARRFHQGSDKPRDTSINDMLAAASEHIRETPEVEHVIVIIGRTIDGASGTKFFQAGSYTHHGQMGLMLEGMHMVRES